MANELQVGQYVVGQLNRADGNHVPFRGRVASTHAANLNGFAIAMVVVDCTDGRRRQAFATDVKALPQVTAREAVPGTRIDLPHTGYVGHRPVVGATTVYVRQWTKADGPYANLMASDTPDGPATYRGMFLADQWLQLGDWA